MKSIFLVLCLCILRSQAVPFSRMANGKIASKTYHACMVLVIRSELIGTDTAVLGSGSIISRRHVLTAAHVLDGVDNTYQINFFVETYRRSFTSNFALIHEAFDDKVYANDIGLIFLQGDNYFSVINVIRLSTHDAHVGVVGTVTGYGFTSKQAIGNASLQPMSANQTVTNSCIFKNYDAAPSHFCALDAVMMGIVCPGDNGAGLYIKNTTTGENELIGVASRVAKGCSEADYTGYTRISQFAGWIKAIANI